MTRTRTLTAAAALLVALAGCSSPAPEAAPTPSASASSRSASERAYLDALRKLDPQLVENEKQALLQGENTCQGLTAGDDEQTVAKGAAKRYVYGGDPVSQAKAEQIVKVLHRTLCPK